MADRKPNNTEIYMTENEGKTDDGKKTQNKF